MLASNVFPIAEVIVVSVDRLSVRNMETERLALIDRIIFSQDVSKTRYRLKWYKYLNEMCSLVT